MTTILRTRLAELADDAPGRAGRHAVAARPPSSFSAALDVSMWKRLRRDDGPSVDEAAEHLRVPVEGVLATVSA